MKRYEFTSPTPIAPNFICARLIPRSVARGGGGIEEAKERGPSSSEILEREPVSRGVNEIISGLVDRIKPSVPIEYRWRKATLQFAMRGSERV